VGPRRDLPPDSKVYFAVGGLDVPRSQAYVVRTAKHTSDVYLGPQPIAHQFKASLHEKTEGKPDTGYWQHAFNSMEKARAFLAEPQEKYVERWTRPPEFAPGWTRMYVFIVPSTELRRYTSREQGNVEFVPPAPPGYAVHFDVLSVVAGSTTRLRVENPTLIASMTLADRSKIKILARPVRPPARWWRWLADEREKAIYELRQEPEALKQDTLVIGRFGRQDDGARCMIELAVTPPAPGQIPICLTAPSRPQGRSAIHLIAAS
jgi:hypothetical protein